ncbi:hypothetical protein ATB54_10290, partial [Xanthomonas translucens]
MKFLLLLSVALGLSGYALIRYYFPAGAMHSHGYGRVALTQPAGPAQGVVILFASGNRAQRQAAAARIAAT